jgi:hypothetical protein
VSALHWIAVVSLGLSVASAAAIAWDIFARGHRQAMAVMNLVWPVTALYAGPLALGAYWRLGRAATSPEQSSKGRGPHAHGHRHPDISASSIALAATHCGAGCTLGDLCAEALLYRFPLSLFGHAIYGAWAVDFAFAFVFGIAFQYFSIKPMRGLSPGKALAAALKADTLALSAWQLGMYGWMATATFAIFGRELEKTDPVFWLMMQVGMLAGFAVSYPVNGWLIRNGVKEAM